MKNQVSSCTEAVETFSSTPQIHIDPNPAVENGLEPLPIAYEATCKTEDSEIITDLVGTKEEKTKLARKRLQDEMGKYISRYDDMIAAQILNEIRNGKLVKPTCDKLGIPPGNVYWWADHNPVFAEMLTKAKLHGAHSLIDECQAIIDNDAQEVLAIGHKDLYDNGKIIAVNNAGPHRDRERVAFRRWLAGKYNPIYLDDAGSINIGVQVNGLDMPRQESRTEWVAAKLVEQGVIATTELPTP